MLSVTACLIRVLLVERSSIFTFVPESDLSVVSVLCKSFLCVCTNSQNLCPEFRFYISRKFSLLSYLYFVEVQLIWGFDGRYFVADLGF